MTINFENGNLVLTLWYVSHRTRALLKKCEDQIYSEYNLTTEQYSVLAAIKHIGGTARPTDIAQWLGRSTNAVSMIIDRMVKAGLLRRVRDRSDRRVVNVSITSKAENALKPAIRAGWEFIQKITSPLSNEDKHTFIKLHDTLRYEIFKYLNPGANVEEMARNDDESHANLMERLIQYALPSTPEANRQGDEKGKPIR
ncbi:MAG: MarR family transcriptional regulator [Candidatus Aminicenantes bacterium]|nr:MAG: MarR family transcriptional regulator [Candidatus Aminicenantes bacterium]